MLKKKALRGKNYYAFSVKPCTVNIFSTYQRESVGAHMHALSIVVVAVSPTGAEGERSWISVSTTNQIREECRAQMDV